MKLWPWGLSRGDVSLYLWPWGLLGVVGHRRCVRRVIPFVSGPFMGIVANVHHDKGSMILHLVHSRLLEEKIHRRHVVCLGFRDFR